MTKSKLRGIPQVYKTYNGSAEYSTYKKVLETFFKLMGEELIDGIIYKLPAQVGILGVFKRPTVGKGMFDYKLYNETGIKSWKKNFHTYKYAANFNWNNKLPFSNLSSYMKACYKFVAVRDLKRSLARKIKTENIIETFYDLN